MTVNPKALRESHSSKALASDLLITPDQRYLVVRGRLWRLSNPALSTERRAELVLELMRARREKRNAIRMNNHDRIDQCRQRIDECKRALGERGPTWWHDGTPDWNRHLVKNTPYADWFTRIATIGEVN